MFEQLEFDFDTPTLKTRNDRWVKSEIRNCNVCGKDYVYITEGPEAAHQQASPYFCCNECWKLAFILINRGSLCFHKLCEVNAITMEDVTWAEEQATRRSFPNLYRAKNNYK